MKRKLMLLLIGGVTAALLTPMISASAKTSYEFDVLSDTHIRGVSDSDLRGDNGSKYQSDAKRDVQQNQRFGRTLDSIAESVRRGQSKSDCIVVNGDCVDYSGDDSYAKLSSIVWDSDNKSKNNSRDKKSQLPYIYFNIGNHEFNKGKYSWSEDSYDYTSSRDRFNNAVNSLKGFNTAKHWITTDNRYGDYDIQYINGKNSRLVFLSLNSSEAAFRMSNEQMEWLASVIRANSAEGGKPMFIFLHEPLYDTTYGSKNDSKGWKYLDISQSQRIKDMLKGHPEIVFFSGHEHYSVADNQVNSMLSNYYYEDVEGGARNNAKYFSIPSVAMSTNENTAYQKQDPEGYHVKVDDNNINVDLVRYTNTGYKSIKTFRIPYHK